MPPPGPGVNCPNLLSSGTCSAGQSCRFNHTILSCEACNYVAQNLHNFNAHLNSGRHHKQIARDARGQHSSAYHCSVCKINVGSSEWDLHMRGKPHRRRAMEQGLSPDVERLDPVSNDRQTFCPLCRFLLQAGSQWNQHVISRRHKQKEAFIKYRTVLDEAEKDKNGITVQGDTDLGYLEPNSANVSATLTLKCSDLAGKTMLVDVALTSRQGSRPVRSGFTIISATVDTFITSRSPGVVKFKFNEPFIGQYDDRLELIFKDTQLAKFFVVSRRLCVVVGNKQDHEALKAKSPYVNRRLRAGGRTPETTVVGGVPPPSVKIVNYIGTLPKATIPRHLLEILNGSEEGVRLRERVANVQRMFMPPSLQSLTYARHFKCLLWVEEHQSDLDLSRYDIAGATLSKHNHYYFLQVPGLAEKRPSVLVGDRMLVQKDSVQSGHWYEGHVHVVRQNEIGLCFHSSFGGWSPAQRYNVRFKLNRIVMKRQHQALDSAFEEDRVFFPVGTHLQRTPITMGHRLSFFNPLIGSNERQAQAVKQIAGMHPGSVPYIVFGPPGTGKTVTIVEAIRQVLAKQPSARILACAPSNSAADLIAERLAVALSPDHLFRMYAPSRAKAAVPDALERYTYLAPQGYGEIRSECFGVPPLRQLQSYRVVVSTCVSASMLSGVGVPRGHFQWVFVDEAGQATEPEVCIPIKTLADPAMNIVLSGDPKQLGPIVRSAVARALGLEISWLERLMTMEEKRGDGVVVYGDQGQGGGIVKLTQNFRSHSAILKFPNERFYGGDLVPCAPEASTRAYAGSNLSPNPDFPVVFHAVLGKDDREASSPSFFNIDEVLQVKSYVQRLKDARGRHRTSDNEIGVIAPYHAQCLKLRTALRSVADGVKVGSVEEFQGQERKAIIISTVRSSKDFVSYDLLHTLGFVANPRRFNVAVTRAKALLIIVGNPHVLGLDPLWRAFLNYIHHGGGWVGLDIPWDPSEALSDDVSGDDYAARVRRAAEVDMNELTRRMAGEVGGEVEGDVNVDRPWRDAE